MNSAIVRNIIYPGYRFIKRDRILEKIKELERNQWLSTEELLELQWRKLRRLLSYAYENVPYYRTLFDRKSIKPENIKTPEDFRNIPILTKDIIRNNIERLVPVNFDRKQLISNSTGGSTGENLKFYNTTAMSEYSRANTVRCNRWCGIQIADKEAYLWGSRFDIKRSAMSSMRLRSFFLNRIYLSSYDLSEDSMKRYADILSRFRPRLIVAYPTPLAAFAEYLIKNKIDTVKPKAIITSAETLFDHQKELVQSAFGCKVFNRYGSREFGNIAQECDEHNGLHINVDRVYLEFLQNGKPVKPGEIGEIFVTDLDNCGMPFIRYKIGDLGVPSNRRCRCGRGLPLMMRVEGRAYDIVRTPSGKALAGTFWSFLSRTVDGIKQFQVIQKEIDRITYRIIVDDTFEPELLKYLHKKIAEHCGEDFKVDFQIVDKIPLSKSGKFRFVISEVNHVER